MNPRTQYGRIAWLLIFTATWLGSGTTHAKQAADHTKRDDTNTLKQMFRRANGGVLRLEADRTYHVRQKIELESLCPRGVSIEGNGATIQALPGFQHGVLLTATVLLRDDPYDPGVTVRDLTLDGNGQVSRPVFGNWGRARVDRLTVKGGTVYQMNAIWNDSTLTDITVQGNADQTNNGFDCNLQNSTIYNIRVDMDGNLKESAFWLNGCQHATVINAQFVDGRTAFGLENCKDVNMINLRVRGKYSFRVVNILPAEPSERIHLYNVDIDSTHVGKDAAAGVHFNATKGGMVARGTIRSRGPGVLLTHGASNVVVWDVDLPTEPVHPRNEWTKSRSRNLWVSKRRDPNLKLGNTAPVVWAGPDRDVDQLTDVNLEATVADESNLRRIKVAWSKLSGPGDVTFGDAKQAKTQANFDKPGVYKLRFVASDGRLQSEDDVILKVRQPRKSA